MPGYFGKSTAFLVADSRDGQVISCSIRSVRPDELQRADWDGLEGCACVICKGIGPQAAQSLREKNILPYVVDRDMKPREAVQAFLEGRLRLSGEFGAAGEAR